MHPSVNYRRLFFPVVIKATLLALVFLMAPSTAWACTYQDPYSDPSGYAQWCSCKGGKLYRDSGNNPACDVSGGVTPQPPPDPANQAFQRAYAMGKAGDLEGAAQHYLEAIRYNNRYAAAHNNLAIIYKKWKQYQKALDHYVMAIKYAQTASERELHRGNLRSLYIEMGYVYLSEKNFSMAESYFRSILGMYPGDADAIKGLDLIRKEKDRDREREANNQGHIRYQEKDYDGAIARYNEALSYCRTSCDYIHKNIALSQRNRQNTRGNLLFDQKDYDSAIAAYETALGYCRSGMDCDYIRNNISAAKQSRENDQRKREIARRNEEDKRLEQKAATLASTGDFVQAENTLKELVARNPKSARYTNSLGINLLAQKRNKAAETAFRNGIKINPDDAVLYYNLALTLERQGRHQEAEKEARTSLYLDPSQKATRKLLDNIEYEKTKRKADKLSNSGEFGQAEEMLREVVSQNPENSSAATKLGNLLMDQFRYKDAEDTYRKGLKHNPDNAAMHYNLSLILKRLGRYEQAGEEAKKALKLDPSDQKAQKLLNSFQKNGFMDRHIDPIIYPVFNTIERSVFVIGSKRKELAKSLRNDYKSIMEQASSAEFHGLLAQGSSGEEAKTESNKVFDTKGYNIGTLITPMVVDAHQFDQVEEIPEELLNNQEWKNLDIRERRAQTKVDQKNKELANLQEMRSSPQITPVKKAMVLIVIAKKKKELIDAEHNKNVVKDEKRKLRKRYKLGKIREVE